MTHAFVPPSGQAKLSESNLRAIAAILHEHAGIVIAAGKGSMVQSRLAKRLRALGLPDYESYISLLTSEDGRAERREMISALTTNVTHFFRENHHFETLRTTALPPLLTRARAGGRVRIWSAGSSNGQEAYSIAMVLSELASDLTRLDIRILATDIDPVMIARGCDGIYEDAAVEAVPQVLRRKYFEPAAEGQRVIEPLRDCVSFRELNLHDPWPMKGQFDIIFCRNVVIYFDPEAQQRLWQRLENALNPGGWLFVGHSERVTLDGTSALKTAGITTYRLPDAGPKDGGSQWH
jgi:chemotaxis protein methyltransferase CheR